MWRWKACLGKAGHQAASNIGAGCGRNQGGIHGRGDLIKESDAWKCLQPVWRVGSELVECDDASRSDRRGRPPDHGYRIALMREHIAAQRSIKWVGNWDLIVGRHQGFDVAVARSFCPGASGL